MMSPMTSPAAGMMTVAMMVAMMLPSVAPSLWRYHRQVRHGGRTALFTVGYASVWAAIGLALFAMSVALPPMAPWLAGTIVLCAGMVQCSEWKMKQLLCCRGACMQSLSSSVGTAWRDGCRLGVDCGASCGAAMAVLFVAGIMHTGMMLLITAAITGERLAPAGVRIARITGGIVFAAGLLRLCIQR